MNKLLLLLLTVNALGYMVMLIDKNNSRTGKRRISEASIITLAIIGGSIGVCAGMYMLRHKKKKKLFQIGLPIILLLQIMLIFFI